MTSSHSGMFAAGLKLADKPPTDVLVEALSSLAVTPPSWDRPAACLGCPPITHVPATTNSTHSGIAATTTPMKASPTMTTASDDEVVVRWLTKLVGSQLEWLADDDERDLIWSLAATRLAERCGRSGEFFFWFFDYFGKLSFFQSFSAYLEN